MDEPKYENIRVKSHGSLTWPSLESMYSENTQDQCYTIS